MAKFAQVGYGSQGQGLGKTTDGYTYVVNDNVRTGDRIQVVSTSRNGNKFATTAVPLHTYKETSKKGQLARLEVVAKGDKDVVKALDKRINQGKMTIGQIETEEQRRGRQVTQSYTGAEVGLNVKGMSQQQYEQATRGANLAKYKQEHPKATFSDHAQETFDSYSKQYMNKGEQ